ncbi:MAG: hypothetical protein ACTSR8_03065 [Promethearchaeota archaeon]
MEFKINNYIQLKLEDGKTNIYIYNKLFRQCKHLLLIVPKNIFGQKDISIDEIANLQISKLEQPEDLGITPEIEFWGHCSNIQAWVENNYDTRIIHSNLAFPKSTIWNKFRFDRSA